MQWLLSDGVGNTSGAVDSAGNIVLQHFDAFGVPIDRIAMATTNPPTTQAACSARNCELCNGLNDPGSRGRAATGPLGYHGQEGYATNCDDPDRLAPLDTADPGYEGYDSTWSAGYEDRSTGLIHIGARDYEPETGRFLQADPIQIDPLPVTWGHLNRWTYCANEPVNAYDLAGFEFSLGGSAPAWQSVPHRRPDLWCDLGLGSRVHDPRCADRRGARSGRVLYIWWGSWSDHCFALGTVFSLGPEGLRQLYYILPFRCVDQIPIRFRFVTPSSSRASAVAVRSMGIRHRILRTQNYQLNLANGKMGRI
ncbi:MAG: RHS repeat-associated core domain-containing protein [Phycisphaerae bacterium]